MKIFVAGATGVAGRRVVKALVDRGHSVTGVARSPEKATLVSNCGGKPTEVDLFDPDQVRNAVAGNEVVVNLTTKIPPLNRAMLRGAWAENDRLREQASSTLVDAALASGVIRYIQESLAFMYRDQGDAWVNEDTAIDPPPHAQSTLVAEEQTRRFNQFGRTGIVLRFGQFYAADASHTISWIRWARRGHSPFVGPPQAFMPLLHADDAARAVVSALDAPGGTYNVVDDEPLRQSQLAEGLGRAIGREDLRFPPTFLMRLGGAKVRMLMRSQRVSNRRFRETTRWEPMWRDAERGFIAVVREMTADV